jgi:hypothetical protein
MGTIDISLSKRKKIQMVYKEKVELHGLNRRLAQNLSPKPKTFLGKKKKKQI